MIELSGSERFAEPVAEVWRRLSDLSFLAEAIPGMSSAARTTDDRLTCKVKPALSFLTGSLSTTIDVLKRSDVRDRADVRNGAEPRLVLGIRSKGIGSMAAVTATFDLRESGGGTAVDWTATVDELGGLLKPVGAGLIEASAGKVIASAWQGFRERLASQHRQRG